MTHAEFREWLDTRINDHWYQAETLRRIGHKDAMLNRERDVCEAESIQAEFNKLPDVAAEIEGVINNQLSQPFVVTADINPYRDGKNDGFSEGLKWVLTKIKELQNDA